MSLWADCCPCVYDGASVYLPGVDSGLRGTTALVVALTFTDSRRRVVDPLVTTDRVTVEPVRLAARLVTLARALVVDPDATLVVDPLALCDVAGIVADVWVAATVFPPSCWTTPAWVSARAVTVSSVPRPSKLLIAEIPAISQCLPALYNLKCVLLFERKSSDARFGSNPCINSPHYNLIP